MTEYVYAQLCRIMTERGGMYPGKDIPEFYELAAELFTPEEARLFVGLPTGLNPAAVIAEALGWQAEAVKPLMEKMADKGLLFTLRKGGETLYGGLPFVPGIFEYQFMRGTHTERDKKLARLIRNYKARIDRHRRFRLDAFPVFRVIPVGRTIQADTQIHTYAQVRSYIDNYAPLSVSICYCRHQARLIDEGSHCGKPDDVCLQFGAGAQYVIDRGMGREISRQGALEILDRAEAAGLVHCTNNRQEIDFLCNCCGCHCIILKNVWMHPKPGVFLNSGFQPDWNAERCSACETCLERCPMDALGFDDENRQSLDLDRCIGCGLCATGCPEAAITMRERPGVSVPPRDRQALKKAVKASLAT
jgi:Pyruvate/2-oxoacid:ferredoxin oxidoreductase delta subunit